MACPRHFETLIHSRRTMNESREGSEAWTRVSSTGEVQSLECSTNDTSGQEDFEWPKSAHRRKISEEEVTSPVKASHEPSASVSRNQLQQEQSHSELELRLETTRSHMHGHLEREQKEHEGEKHRPPAEFDGHQSVQTEIEPDTDSGQAAVQSRQQTGALMKQKAKCTGRSTVGTLALNETQR